MSTPQAQHPQQQQQQQQRRRKLTRRLRVACSRCHQRKIRCDAATPSCTACVKARETCIYDGDLPPARRRQLGAETLHLADMDMHRLSPRDDDATRSGLSPPDGTDIRVRHSAAASGRSNGLLVETLTPPAPITHSPEPRPATPPEGNLSHEVGLVSLSAGVDPKYIGSSSGFFFTQMLKSASRGRESRAVDGTRLQEEREIATRAFRDVSVELPRSADLTRLLSKAFFESIHVQYPFLHEPSHNDLIQQVYDGSSTDKISTFQVTMVLSIAALIRTRRSHVELPCGGWCATAINNFSSVHVEHSLRGVQCLLLMMMYAMHSPSSHLNAWSINYQCIAMVIDLGLQREPSRTAPLSLLQRELRTRVFWVVYSLDRKLSTMMGRPIGLRDEACDFRLPAAVDDACLGHGVTDISDPLDITHMHYAIHCFKLARMNSEMKYVLHSVNRGPPSYAYPAIRDLTEWQTSMKTRLNEWLAGIPQHSQDSFEYGRLLCESQYHTINMLLFLPSPAIPNPSPRSLRNCLDSSIHAIKLFRTLYARDLLLYNWSTCHSLILHAFCTIYCAAANPQLRAETTNESLWASLRAASDVLSATGEYWAGAKRTRDLLNDLATKVLWRQSYNGDSTNAAPRPHLSVPVSNPPPQSQMGSLNPLGDEEIFHADAGLAPSGDAGVQNDDYLSGMQWEEHEMQSFPFLFGDQLDNASFGGTEFDIGNLFVDAIDISGDGIGPV